MHRIVESSPLPTDSRVAVAQMWLHSTGHQSPTATPWMLSAREQTAAGRQCAVQALAGIGVVAEAPPTGHDGAPIWPAGTVGSITHCPGYVAAAAGRSDHFHGIGIDAEPLQNLPDSVVRRFCGTRDLELLSKLRELHPQIPWSVVFFSLKESVFKCRNSSGLPRLSIKRIPVHLASTAGSSTDRGPVKFASDDTACEWRLIGSLVLTSALREVSKS